MRNLSRCHDAHRQEILTALGLAWIAPELRENRGEIEAAARGELAPLIELKDLQGDLHAHTSASDGRESMSKMVAAAQARDLQFMAITDHSRYLGVDADIAGARAPYAVSFDKILDAARRPSLRPGTQRSARMSGYGRYPMQGRARARRAG